jgi:hypothetical protein
MFKKLVLIAACACGITSGALANESALRSKAEICLEKFKDLSTSADYVECLNGAYGNWATINLPKKDNDGWRTCMRKTDGDLLWSKDCSKEPEAVQNLDENPELEADIIAKKLDILGAEAYIQVLQAQLDLAKDSTISQEGNLLIQIVEVTLLTTEIRLARLKSERDVLEAGITDLTSDEAAEVFFKAYAKHRSWPKEGSLLEQFKKEAR